MEIKKSVVDEKEGIIPKVWGVKFLSIQFHYSI